MKNLRSSKSYEKGTKIKWEGRFMNNEATNLILHLLKGENCYLNR